MSKPTSKKYLRKRHTRRQKLHYWRRRYAKTTSQDDRKKILEKIAQIAPWLSVENFLKD